MRPFRLAVLDGLRLVEHDDAPADFAERLDFALEQTVGDDHQRRRRGFREHFSAVPLPENDRLERRREPFALLQPIVADGCRRDDQGGAFLRLGGDEGEGLKRFAETHVIGETSARAPGVKSGKPLEAFDLVFSQLDVRAQVVRQFWLEGHGGVNFLHLAHPFGGAHAVGEAGVVEEQLRRGDGETVDDKAPLRIEGADGVEIVQAAFEILRKSQNLAVAESNEIAFLL